MPLRNCVGREVVRKGSVPILDSWCKQQKVLESETVGRWIELKQSKKIHTKKWKMRPFR